ncbi:Galactoside 2-alpha-L-fucosyltransferase 2-like 2, partial [Homarus americanus]
VFSNTTWIQWPLMVFSTVGRLGNCLNSYATALTFHGRYPATVAVTEYIFKRIASLVFREHLEIPVVSEELYLDAHDMGVVEKVKPDYLKNDMVSHLVPTFLRAVSEYQHHPQEKVFILEGYPNRMRLLAGHHHTIRNNFKIRPDLQATALSFLSRVRARRGRNVTFVGVHVRRGDYVRYMEYYTAALQHFRLALANPVFVVCSDDLPHAREHLDKHTDVIFSDLARPEEDLALLAACNHSIMTVGSFGFWASYLTGGHVVYPHLKKCPVTPFIHPDTLGPTGYDNWLAIPVQ